MTTKTLSWSKIVGSLEEKGSYSQVIRNTGGYLVGFSKEALVMPKSGTQGNVTFILVRTFPLLGGETQVKLAEANKGIY